MLDTDLMDDFIIKFLEKIDEDLANKFEKPDMSEDPEWIENAKENLYEVIEDFLNEIDSEI